MLRCGPDHLHRGESGHPIAELRRAHDRSCPAGQPLINSSQRAGRRPSDWRRFDPDALNAAFYYRRRQSPTPRPLGRSSPAIRAGAQTSTPLLAPARSHLGPAPIAAKPVDRRRLQGRQRTESPTPGRARLPTQSQEENFTTPSWDSLGQPLDATGSRVQCTRCASRRSARTTLHWGRHQNLEKSGIREPEKSLVKAQNRGACGLDERRQSTGGSGREGRTSIVNFRSGRTDLDLGHRLVWASVKPSFDILDTAPNTNEPADTSSYETLMSTRWGPS